MGRHLSTILGLASIMLSCQKDHVPTIETDNPPNLRELTNLESQVVRASNNFAFDILREVNKEETNENFMISPLSVGTALSMVANGAGGETKNEILDVLGYDGLLDGEMNLAYKGLQDLLLHIDKKTNFSIANSIWYNNQFTLKDGFRPIIEDYYAGAIEPLNFNNPQSKDVINQWVEEHTNQKIKDLIKEVRPDHLMFLVNAIYFKGTWTYKFDKSKTKPMDFYKADGSVVSRDMMFSDKLRYLLSYDEQAMFISLPYGNQQFYMNILMPLQNQDIDRILNDLDAGKLRSYVQSSDTSGLQLYMPKFKLEYEKEMNDPLIRLGMESAFSNGANFTELVNESVSIKIDKVNHKTFIEVDEEGTEAAAATSVEMVVLSSVPGPPLSIHINRPFIFFITEKSSETILFAGKIMDPQR